MFNLRGRACWLTHCCWLGRCLGQRLQNVVSCEDYTAAIKKCQGFELDQETGQYTKLIPYVTDPATQCEEFGEGPSLAALAQGVAALAQGGAGVAALLEPVGRDVNVGDGDKLDIMSFVHETMPHHVFELKPKEIFVKAMLAVVQKLVLKKQNMGHGTRLEVVNALLHHPKAAKNLNLVQYLMMIP